MADLRGPLMALAVLAAGCDDELFIPCGEYEPTWHGVQCLMNSQCVSCHAEEHPDYVPTIVTVLPGDVYADVLDGFDGDPLVVPGDPEASRLWRVLVAPDSAQQDFGLMPWGYTKPLPDSQIGHVREWIENGAPLD